MRFNTRLLPQFIILNIIFITMLSSMIYMMYLGRLETNTATILGLVFLSSAYGIFILSIKDVYFKNN